MQDLIIRIVFFMVVMLLSSVAGDVLASAFISDRSYSYYISINHVMLEWVITVVIAAVAHTLTVERAVVWMRDTVEKAAKDIDRPKKDE